LTGVTLFGAKLWTPVKWKKLQSFQGVEKMGGCFETLELACDRGSAKRLPSLLYLLLSVQNDGGTDGGGRLGGGEELCHEKKSSRKRSKTKLS